MAGRVGSIEDIAWRGHRLRLWCFGCARSRVVDAGKVLQMFADRGWDLALETAALRFPCLRCRSARQVMILPARPLAPPPPDPQPPERERTWADEVVGFFHATRSKRKEKPLPKSAIKALDRLAQKHRAKDNSCPSRKRIEDLE